MREVPEALRVPAQPGAEAVGRAVAKRSTPSLTASSSPAAIAVYVVTQPSISQSGAPLGRREAHASSSVSSSKVTSRPVARAISSAAPRRG